MGMNIRIPFHKFLDQSSNCQLWKGMCPMQLVHMRYMSLQPQRRCMLGWLVNGFIVDWCETKTHQTTDQIHSYWNRMLPNSGELCFLYTICISHTVMTWSPFRHNVKRKHQAPRQHIFAITREIMKFSNKHLYHSIVISCLYTQSFSVNFVLKRPQFTWATKGFPINVRRERRKNCEINESAFTNKVICYVFHISLICIFRFKCQKNRAHLHRTSKRNSSPSWTAH